MRGKRWLRLLAWCYAGMMFMLLLGGRRVRSPGSWQQGLTEMGNFRPLKTIGLYVRLLHNPAPRLRWEAVKNLGGNLLLFLPLGFFPPALSPGFRSAGKTVLLAFGIMAAVELTQAITGLGRLDVDDLLLNTLGAALGYGIFAWIRKSRGENG